MRLGRAALLVLALSALGCADEVIPCESDADCDGTRCRADDASSVDDLEAQPLVCGEAGEGGEPGEACDNADACALGLCLLAGACARPCDVSSACAAGERCQDVFARNGAHALTRLRACVSIVDAPDGVEVETELREGALVDGESEVALDAVEADATTLVVLQHGSPTWPDTTFCRPPLCVLELRASEQTLFRADACQTELLAIATGDQIDPAVIRLSGAAAELGGADGYVATLMSEAPGDLQVTRIASTHARERLDLNLFYVGARDLERRGERGPALVAEALDTVDEIFTQAGIYIGDVRQIDVPGELPARGTAYPEGDQSQGFATLAVRYGVHVELPHLFRLSAGASNSAVDVFFVGEIEPRDGDGEPEAEAGGVPGPLGMHGTGGSGIVISSDMMAGEPEALGRTLAHELGHFLGLFHTSEADGCVRDVLEDTPACTLEQDVDADGLGVDDCVEHGADNLMFWAKMDAGTMLSAAQIAVLRSAAVLQ